jgi:hypothetical protein
MGAYRGKIIYSKDAIRKRQTFNLAEQYAYPIISAYLCDRIAKFGMTKIGFIHEINKKYGVSYSIKFLYNLNKGWHKKPIHLGHINMFAGFFGETILDFCKFYAENAKK